MLGVADVIQLMHSYKDQLELRPIEKITPYERVIREHTDKQVQQLCASMLEYGVMRPLIVDGKGTIISGYGVYLAALKLGLTILPAIRVTHLTEAQIAAYRMADNKLGDMSKFIKNELVIEMKKLIELNYDVELIGFSATEIDILIDEAEAEPPVSKDDLIPEPEIIVVSRLGDLWELGENRLLCADATQQVSYIALMHNQLAQMVFSDPPYNVPIDRFVTGSGKHREFVMASGKMPGEEFTGFLGNASRNIASHTMPAGIVYLCMDWRHLPELTAATAPVFGPPKQLCVWVKDNGGMGAFYRSQHEMVMVFKNGEGQHINNFKLGETGRYRTNVWQYAGVNTFRKGRLEDLADHPTVKPTALVADAIRDCSKRGGIILDPFIGSGTTILAAQRTGRRCYGMELDPRYVDVAIRRWQQRTGKEAILTATGQTFAEVAAERSLQPAAEEVSA